MRDKGQRRAVGGPVLPAETGRDTSLPYGLREKRGGVRRSAGGDDCEGEGGEEGEPCVVKREVHAKPILHFYPNGHIFANYL